MEEKIFKQGCLRLESPDAVAYINSQSLQPIKYQAWFEDQVDQALNDSDNKSLPFDLPAVLWQFPPTQYKVGNGSSKDGSGSFILHIVQSKYCEGSTDSAELEDYHKLLAYAQAIIDLLDGYKLECTAKPYMTQVERDHLNRPVMVDKITFSWTGRRVKDSSTPQ